MSDEVAGSGVVGVNGKRRVIAESRIDGAHLGVALVDVGSFDVDIDRKEIVEELRREVEAYGGAVDV